MATLRSQFDQALTNIEINKDKAERAIRPAMRIPRSATC